MEVIFTMVNYRRSQLAGGTFFFTVNLRNRSANTLVSHVDLLRQSFRRVKEQQPFDIEAVVVLPEHLHLIMTLPEGDNDYPERWRAIKSHFGRSLRKAGMVLIGVVLRRWRGPWVWGVVRPSVSVLACALELALARCPGSASWVPWSSLWLIPRIPFRCMPGYVWCGVAWMERSAVRVSLDGARRIPRELFH